MLYDNPYFEKAGFQIHKLKEKKLGTRSVSVSREEKNIESLIFKKLGSVSGRTHRSKITIKSMVLQ